MQFYSRKALDNEGLPSGACQNATIYVGGECALV